MTRKLTISDDLSLPLEAVTQTFAILAKRGVGKSYTASVLAEEMLRAGQQIVAIDPTGGWWGLQSSSDGKSAGYRVVVAGGEHANIPLEESAGEVIAKAIVEHRFSAVLDLGLLRKGATIRFMLAFAETLYRLNREPLHLFVDEADAFAPQGRTYGGDENRMLGAMEDIVRRGRKRGIGCTLITQRPAVLNKNVLTQCESLFAMRMTHPRDIDAISEWVNVHAEPAESKSVIDSLPSLPIGTAWFWSPGWIGALKQIQVRRRETFDSSATPKPGESPREPRKRVEIDLEMLGEQIKATVQRVKQDDPRELRRQIADLEKRLAEKLVQPPLAPAVQAPKRIEVPVLKNGQLEKATRLADRLRVVSEKAATEASNLASAIGRFTNAVGALKPAVPQPVAKPATQAVARPHAKPVVGPLAGRGDDASVNGRLPIGEKKILSALIQHPGGLRREQLTVLSGYKRSSCDTYVDRLRAKLYVDTSGDRLIVTSAGQDAVPDVCMLPSGTALRDYWMLRLPRGERKILAALVAIYPRTMERSALDEITGYKASSRDTYLDRLAAKELVVKAGQGAVAASEDLF